ncbi:MAG: hypothetical protein ACI31S_01115 [Bacilli bacterium]
MKNNKKIIVVTIVLSILVIIMGSFIIYDKFIKDNDNTQINNSNENDNNNDVSLTVEDSYVNININYSGEYIDLNKYIKEFNDNEDYKNKLLNIVVSKINIGEKYYTFKLNNHPQDCLKVLAEEETYNDNYNLFYINDKKIYQWNNQSCYLEMVKFITVIDNKYIGIYFEGQGGNYMKVYDENIELVDELEAKSISIVDGEINFTDYEKDDKECKLNTYLYEISDGKPTKTLKERGTESYCNQMTGEGCCK